MHIATLHIFLFFPYAIVCRNAIQFFATHRKVRNMTIEVLKNLDNSTTRWVEYKYIFENKQDQPEVLNASLKVGVFVDTHTKFDLVHCGLHPGQTIRGYNGAIINTLQDTLNISTEFIFTDNLTLLTTNEIDLLVCQPHLEVLPSEVTELHPTIRSNLMLVYKPAKLHFTKDIFILTFAGSLWVVFFTIMILLALCLRVSTHQYAMIRPKYESWTWVEITLWAIAAACQQGLSHTPSGFASCLIFFLGYLMAYLLYTGFAAAITSILVENVETNADLRSVRFGKLHLVSLEGIRFHIKEFQGSFLVTEYVDDLKALFKELDKDNKIGIGPEISIQQYMVKNFDYDQISGFQTMKLNIPYTKSFIMLKNNPWRKIINQHIVALDQFGILKNQLKRNLRPVSSLLHSGYSSAGQEHVGSAILLFLGGALISLLFLVAEFVFCFYKRGRNHTNKN